MSWFLSSIWKINLKEGISNRRPTAIAIQQHLLSEKERNDRWCQGKSHVGGRSS
jgi:hypothetical protein